MFIAGLIVLNNTFLESYYTTSRETSLMLAFDQVADVDLTEDSDTLANELLAIENSYNLRIQVLQQNPFPDTTPPISDLSPYLTRLYGDQFSIRWNQINEIIGTFDEVSSGTASDSIEVVTVASDPSYVAYMAPLAAGPGGENAEDQATVLALCVAKEQDTGLYVFYIMTVTIQSISDSIQIFNTFTLIIGMVFMILSGVLTYFYSYRFTNPILQMTQVTKELANLNFDTRVDIQTQDELGDLGNSINKMSDQLEISIKDLQSANEKLAADIELKTNIDTMRKEFIANASHELKTPISLIIGYSEAMRLPGLKPEDVHEYLDIIDDEANKMDKLVMNLLKISQLESGFQQLTLEDFSLRDLVEETSKLFGLKITEKEATLQTDVEDVFIHSDYDSLQTVLTNFLSNALNHVEGERLIRIQSVRREDGAIRITVFNSGKHIPDDSLSRIWESFYKVDKARTRAYGGQGLGLSIVRSTLENLGCRYGVLNVEHGVEFFFEVVPNLINKSESR
jgi:signal transduction histidine kinase